MTPNLSEDDIRTKVLYTWLKGCGLNDHDIYIEYTIPLRLGHGTQTVSSRSDILVKNAAGNNLLIIEVKKPSHDLVEGDKWQAISYGRSLATGGIAPITILSNGVDTRIYDTVTADLISDHSVAFDHQIIQSGFKATGNGITARAQALEYLITLSSENLLAFCKGQVAYRMALLKGEDIDSGKKYVPKLYVDRSLSREQLDLKLFGDHKHEVVLVVGPPQHGKTCFICASVDHYLEKNIPCLIYPAVGLQGSLLDAIAEDFEWGTTESISHSQIIQRLHHILADRGEQLILFIDGWNEMIAHAVAINKECARLHEKKIQVVISTTSTSVPRLLKDSADNIEYIAGKINLTEAQITRLSKEPLVNTQGTSLVQIGKFSNEELRQAKHVHEQHFNVRFSDKSNLPADPFYLRLAAESFRNSCVPDFATRTELIRDSIIRKAKRRNIETQTLLFGLGQLMSFAFENDTPIGATDLPQAISIPQNLNNWLESALLMQTEDEHRLPVYDFYYTHERDYSFALNRKWLNGFKRLDQDKRSQEINQTIKTEAGRSALRWFLSCPEHVDESPLLYDIVNEGAHTNEVLQRIIGDALLNQFRYHGSKDFQWLEKHVQLLLSKNSNEDPPDVLAEMVSYYLLSIDKENNYDDYKFWYRVLLKSDHNIDSAGYLGSYVYRLTEEAEAFSRTGYSDDCEVDIELLSNFIEDEDHEIAQRAAICIAGATPNQFLTDMPKYAERFTLINRKDLCDIVVNACNSILDIEQGLDMSGFCESARDFRSRQLYTGEIDEHAYNEYIEKRPLWAKAVRYVTFPKATIDRITSVLEDLRCRSGIDSDLGKNEIFDYETSYDPNQLKLDL